MRVRWPESRRIQMSSLERKGCDGTNRIIQRDDLTLSLQRLYFTSLERNEMSLNWDNCFISENSIWSPCCLQISDTQLFSALKTGTVNCQFSYVAWHGEVSKCPRSQQRQAWVFPPRLTRGGRSLFAEKDSSDVQAELTTWYSRRRECYPETLVTACWASTCVWRLAVIYFWQVKGTVKN